MGSYTNLDSSQNIPQTDSAGNIIGEETTDFFAVSDSSYNASLAYDHSGFGARLSYVWREKFLNNNEARIFANPIGIWRRPESSLDLQLNYDFNENFSISFDAVNLTDEMSQSYYHFADVGDPTSRTSATCSLAASSRSGCVGKQLVRAGPKTGTESRGARNCAAAFFRRSRFGYSR